MNNLNESKELIKFKTDTFKLTKKLMKNNTQVFVLEEQKKYTKCLYKQSNLSYVLSERSNENGFFSVDARLQILNILSKVVQNSKFFYVLTFDNFMFDHKKIWHQIETNETDNVEYFKYKQKMLLIESINFLIENHFKHLNQKEIAKITNVTASRISDIAMKKLDKNRIEYYFKIFMKLKESDKKTRKIKIKLDKIEDFV